MIDTQKVKDYTNYTFGVGVGYATYKGAKVIVEKPLNKVIGKLAEQALNGSETDNDTYYAAAQRAYDKAKLKDKGITIVELNPENVDEYISKIEAEEKAEEEKLKEKHAKQEEERKAKSKAREEERIRKWEEEHGKKYEKSEFEKKLDRKLEKYLENMDKTFEKINEKIENWSERMRKKNAEDLREISKGENACFMPATSEVLVNKKKLAFSTFHEMGHGIVQKASKLGKINAVAGIVLPTVAIPIITGIGLLKNKKEAGEKSKGFFGKAFTFIKENCAILTALCMLPQLADEAMASINGAKLAKPELDKNMYRKLLKKQGAAYSTYVIGAALICGIVKFAVTARDAVVESKVIK